MDMIAEIIFGMLPQLALLVFIIAGPILLITSIHHEVWGDTVIQVPAFKLGLLLCGVDVIIIGAVVLSQCL